MKGKKMLAIAVASTMLSSTVNLQAQTQLASAMAVQDVNQDGIVDLYDMVRVSRGTEKFSVQNEAKLQTAKVAYSAPEIVTIGQTFNIVINISNVTDLYGASLDLTYDPELIEIQSIKKGNAFDEKILMPINTINKGKASIVLLQKGNIPGVVIDESKSLIVLTVKALKTGQFTMGDNATIKLADSGARPIEYTKPKANIKLQEIQYVDVLIPEFDITINREKVDNKRNKYPLIVHKNITYMPLTWDYCQALGLESGFDQIEGLVVDKIGGTAPLKQDLTGNNELGKVETAIQPTYKIMVNGKQIDNSKQEFPILNFRDITYFPLTWNFAVDEFGWEINSEDLKDKGYFISSIGPIKPPIESVKLNKTEITLIEEEQEQLVATITPDYVFDKTIKWSSSDDAIATVDKNGIVTAHKKGEVTITAATVEEKHKATCKVTVKAKPQPEQKVKVSIPTFDVSINRTKIDNKRNKFPTIIYENITYLPLVWDYCAALGLSSEYTVEKGLILNQTGGTVPLKQDLSENNILGGDYEATKPTYDIKVNGKLIDNETQEYPILNFREATYFPLTYAFTKTEFGWETNSENLKDKGFFISSIGPAEVPVEGINLNKEKLQLEIGQEEKLVAQVAPEDAFNQKVKWISSKPEIVTVDENGTVQAKSKGTANITVATEDGNYQAQCEVTVVAGEPEVEKIDVTIPTFNVIVNGVLIDNQKNLYPMFEYKGITYMPMTWNYCQALGLTSDFNQGNGLTIFQTGTTGPVIQDLTGNNEIGGIYTVEKPIYSIQVNGRYIDNSTQEYPIFTFKEITYFPLTWEFAREEFGWNTTWSEVDGYTINSQVNSIQETALEEINLGIEDEIESENEEGIPEIEETPGIEEEETIPEIEDKEETEESIPEIEDEEETEEESIQEIK